MVEEAWDIDEQLIAARVCPTIPVNLKEGQYPKLTRGDFGLMDAISTQRAPGSPYAKTVRSVDRDTYACTEYGIEDVIDYSWEAYFSGRYPLDLEAQSSMKNTRNLRMGFEQRVANLVMNSANFTATAVATAWTNANQVVSGANPVVDIENAYYAVKQNGQNPDTMILSFPLFKYITSNPNFQNWYKPYGISGPGQIPDLNAIKMAFQGLGIKEVFIAFANANTSGITGQFTPTPIWGNTYVWVGKKGTGSLANGDAGAFGALYWSKVGAFVQNETYYDQKIKSTVVRSIMYETEKVFDSSCGVLLTTSYTGS